MKWEKRRLYINTFDSASDFFWFRKKPKAGKNSIFSANIGDILSAKKGSKK